MRPCQDFTMLLGVVVVCIWSTPFAATGVVPVPLTAGVSDDV